MGIFREDDGISLLCVEDEEISRFMLRKVISRKFPAIKIHTAEDGKSGLELFNKISPDIVLTDINMPSMNGILMASEIRRINPSTEILIISAEAIACYESDFSRIGISHCLHKPVVFEEIFHAIESSVASITSRCVGFH
ncbi:MAG: response regulator transcription factor [Geobacteraceae bacterium]